MRGSDAADIRIETDRQVEPVVLIVAADDLASQELRQQRRTTRAHGDHRLGANGNLLIGADEDPEAADICGHAKSVNECQIAVVTVDFHVDLQRSPRGPSTVTPGGLGGWIDGTDTCRKGRRVGHSTFVSSWPLPRLHFGHNSLRIDFLERLSSVHLIPFGRSHNDPTEDFSI